MELGDDFNFAMKPDSIPAPARKSMDRARWECNWPAAPSDFSVCSSPGHREKPNQPVCWQIIQNESLRYKARLDSGSNKEIEIRNFGLGKDFVRIIGRQIEQDAPMSDQDRL